MNGSNETLRPTWTGDHPTNASKKTDKVTANSKKVTAVSWPGALNRLSIEDQILLEETSVRGR